MNIMFKKLMWNALLMILMASQLITHANAQTANDGARIYNQNCARCHNPRAAQEFTEEEWSVIMPHMRHAAHLTGEETRSVEMFLAVTLTAEKAKSPQLDATDLSATDLISSFSCTGCHQLNSEGGTIGPSLDNISDRRDSEYIVHKLLEPTFDNRASPMPKFPLTENDARKISEYLTNH